MENKRVSVGYKKRKPGRPPSAIKSVRVDVRLPVPLVEAFQKGRGVSKEIQERLVQSHMDDFADPRLKQLAGAIDALAIDVRRTYGIEWHEDRKAHLAFAEAIRRFLAAMPLPSADKSALTVDPVAAGEMICARYLAGVREAENSRTLIGPARLTMQPTLAELAARLPKSKAEKKR